MTDLRQAAPQPDEIELRRLHAENEALRADAQRYRKLTADADFAASIMADAYSTWDTDDDWGPWLTAYIDEGKWLTANINKGKP